MGFGLIDVFKISLGRNPEPRICLSTSLQFRIIGPNVCV